MCELLEKDREISKLKIALETQIEKYNQLKEQYDSLNVLFTNYVDKTLVNAIREKDSGSFSIVNCVKSDSFAEKLRNEISVNFPNKNVVINFISNTYLISWSTKPNQVEDEYNRVYSIS